MGAAIDVYNEKRDQIHKEGFKVLKLLLKP